MPSYSDLEGNPVTVSMSNAPAFITLDVGSVPPKVYMNPVSTSDEGLYDVVITLSDGQKSIDYNLKIAVANTPPYFISGSISDSTVKLNIVQEIDLPAM